MLLTCPQCTISYEIPIELPEDGKKVRCAKCSHVWVAHPQDDIQQVADIPDPLSEMEAAAGIDEFEDDLSDIDAEPPNAMADELEFREEEPAPPEDDFSMEAATEQESEDQDQDAIDAMMAEAAPDEENDQDGIDALFDEPAPQEEDNDQSDIDAMFDELPAESEENDQAGIDSLFDEPSPPMEQPVEPPAPEFEEIPQQTMAPPPQNERAPIPVAGPPRAAPPPPRQPENKQQVAFLAAGWGALLASVVGFTAYAYFASDSVVRTIPGAAKIYESAGVPINVRGLEFRGVSYSWEAEGGQPVLRVKGSVINVTDKTMSVPKIVFALRDEKGTELFHWAKNVYQGPLSAGQSAMFTARIPSPPTSVRSLQVRFAKVETR